MSEVFTIDTVAQAFGGQQQQPQFKPAGYHFVEFMKQMKSPVVLEIGCDVGDTSQLLLDCNESLKLYTIDPYGDRFKLYRLTSDDAADEFEKEFFDLIFIDGLHTYEQLSKDCANYYSKLKTGGIFAGHDYTVSEGVNRAVNEFVAKQNKEVIQGDCDTWFWVK